MKDKIISCLVLILLVSNLLHFGFSTNVSAEETFEDAVEVNDGDNIQDYLDVNNDSKDYYKIYVEADRYLEVIMLGDHGDFDLYLYDENYSLFYYSHNSDSSNEWAQKKIETAQYIYIKAIAIEGNGNYSIEFWSGRHLDIYEDHYYYFILNDVKTGDHLEYIMDLDSSSPKIDVYLMDSENYYKYKNFKSSSPSMKHIATSYVRANYTFNITPLAPVSIKPEYTHNSTPELSWNSNNDYYLIFDFTNYDTDPPWNLWTDIAHLFMDYNLTRGSGEPDIIYNINVWEGQDSDGPNIIENATTYENTFTITDELEYNQEYYIEIFAEKDGVESEITSSSMYVINNDPFAYAYFPFENPTIYEFEPIFISGGKSFDMDGDEITYSWDMGDGTILSGPDIVYLYKKSGYYDIVLNVTDSIGASGTFLINISVEAFNYSRYNLNQIIENGLTTRVYTNYSINSPIDISSGWHRIPMPWPFSDRSFEIALIFNTTLNHTGYVDYNFTITESGDTIEIETEIAGAQDDYTLIFRPEIRFSWYKHSNRVINQITFPFPTLTEVYPGQPIILLPYIGNVYFWQDFIELQNDSYTDALGTLHEMLADVDIIEIDIYAYIMELVDHLTWPGFMDLANFFLDVFFDIQIEIWLAFGIEIFTKVSETSMFYLETSGEFNDVDEEPYSEGDYFISDRGLVEFYYPDKKTSTISVSEPNTTTALSMYSFNFIYMNPGVLGYLDLKYRFDNDDPYDRIRLFETNSLERYAMDATYFETQLTYIAKDLDKDGIPDVSDDDIDGDGHINSEDAYPRDSTRHSSQTELEKILGNPTIWILVICIIVICAIYIVAKKRK